MSHSIIRYKYKNLSSRNEKIKAHFRKEVKSELGNEILKDTKIIVTGKLKDSFILDDKNLSNFIDFSKRIEQNTIITLFRKMDIHPLNFLDFEKIVKQTPFSQKIKVTIDLRNFMDNTHCSMQKKIEYLKNKVKFFNENFFGFEISISLKYNSETGSFATNDYKEQIENLKGLIAEISPNDSNIIIYSDYYSFEEMKILIYQFI